MEIQVSERLLERENAPIRVLIVDDHALLRQGIRVMLNEAEDFEVVGEAENEKAALWFCTELKPHIVLVNTTVGTYGGLELAKQLLRNSPASRIVLFSGSNDEKLLFDAIRIGVHGYLHKTLSIDDLRRALRAVQCGERVIGQARAITQVMLEFHRLAQEQNRLNWGLSPKEIEVVRLAAEGCTNKEIGIRLFWSEVQVKRKMQDIYRKLQVADRAQAVAAAMRHGLI
jgi:DNA-binding NarL/FixJ family response regulator